MKFGMILPWAALVAALAGAGVLYSSSQKQAGDLAQLREENQKLRAAADEAQNSQAKAENEELTRLRRENEELLRLRNEVRVLRGEKQQLAGQVQSAQAQAQTAQAQMQAQAQAQAQGLRAPPGSGTLTPEQQAFRARFGDVSPEQANVNACLNNLRLIDAAKQQWALEKGRPAGGLVGLNDLTAYFRSNAVPVCPAGGVYTVNPIGIAPICNIPGHALPQ